MAGLNDGSAGLDEGTALKFQNALGQPPSLIINLNTAPTSFLLLEDGTSLFLLEDGVSYIGLEN